MLWDAAEWDRFHAMSASLAQVSTATANQMLLMNGWRNTFMLGLSPIEPLGLGVRIVGRIRTCRYLTRREPQGARDFEPKAEAPDISLIETIEPGDIFCVDALGVSTAGVIGDIMSARLKTLGASAAVIYGVVRDTPYIKQVDLPVFCLGSHPAASGRDLVAVDRDIPINLAGVHAVPGDVILADDEGVVAMPLHLAEYVASQGPDKEKLELWIRDKILNGGAIKDYYPPTEEKRLEYLREIGPRNES